ncbi:MAG: deoxyribodipyrimidine photo-lyase [Actinobacteria bacterium]|nr:deoxyribodipyrimidine photo-lyase [Actinomycetota bacterium]
MARSILWFRRDLRVVEHPALAAAHEHGEVVPVYVLDPAFEAAGAPRRAYLAAALRELDGQLGGRLVVRAGDPVEVVPALAAEVAADSVFVTRDHGPYGRRRDGAVADRLRSDGRAFRGVGSNYALEPGTVGKADGSPYSVFTPFAKRWLAIGADEWPDRPATPPVDDVRWVGAPDVERVALPPLPEGVPPEGLPDASADAVRAQWADFVDLRLDDYDEQRNLPGRDGTSRMSIALRWGVVHPLELIDDLRDERAHRVFRTELAWRDFYADVLLHRPETAWQNLQPKMDAMPVDTDAAARRRFRRWCDGTTGFPVVDAGMRQMLATGWMHNRVRMIVASFLVKDLHLPWQWGARHFMLHLLDGDLASNNHSWQWTAGTGTDASPYYRIFNTTAQSERFDPDGSYIRRWVPELADLPDRVIHAPSGAKPEAYPAPMVDHAAERIDALARYKSVTSSSR